MSNLTLIIGNKNYSSWSLRPWIFLRQNNIHFNERRIALFTDSSDAQLAEYNSDFKVPVLKDGEHLIWDSLAILEYVSEVFLDGHGWPHDAIARATARSISCEMHSSFAHVRAEMPMNCRKTFSGVSLSAAAQHEVQRIKELWRQCRSVYGKHGPWLFGDYSIADAMYAPIVLRFKGYSVPLSGIEQAYVDTVMRQPAIVEWIAAGTAESEVIEADEIQT